MNRKTLIIYSLFLVLVVLTAILAYVALAPKPKITPHSTPPIPFIADFSTSDSKANIPNYPRWFNVSQGATLAVNLTIQSKTGEMLSIPVSLQVAYYNTTVELGGWIYTLNNYTDLQEKTFTYSLNANPLTLQPIMSNSTIITLNIAKDAQIGEYIVQVNMEIPPNGEVQDGFAIIVNGK